MSDNTDTLGTSLNLKPLEKEDYKPITIEHNTGTVSSSTKQAETDVDYVRRNFYDLIEKGTRSFDELSAIADQSQHPRSYEVLSSLIKTLVDTNKELLDLHDKKKKILEKPQESQTGTVNNNLFVGSTKDLLKMIKDNDDTPERD